MFTVQKDTEGYTQYHTHSYIHTHTHRGNCVGRLSGSRGSSDLVNNTKRKLVIEQEVERQIAEQDLILLPPTYTHTHRLMHAHEHTHIYHKTISTLLGLI